MLQAWGKAHRGSEATQPGLRGPVLRTEAVLGAEMSHGLSGDRRWDVSV